MISSLSYSVLSIHMDSDTPTQELAEAIVAFEQALEELVLESYMEGVPVEGIWDITIPVTDAPNWAVTIEKLYTEEPSPYQPSLLEE